MIKKNNRGDYMKNKENILIGLLVVVIVAAGFMFFRQEKALNELTETVDEVVTQVDGFIKQTDEAAKQEEADDLEIKKVLEEREKLDGELGKSVVKLAITIEVDKESQNAKVLISNSKYTKHNIRYDLYLNDDSKDAKKLLYSNEEIKPAETVEYVRLNEVLEVGTYKGSVMICDNQEGKLKACSTNTNSTHYNVTIVVK